jgi:hypothetical protein
MLTVAGGIILAVLFFVFLPLIIVIASHLMVVASALFVLALIAGLALVAVSVDPAAAVMLALVGGVSLFAWCWTMKAPRTTVTEPDHQIDKDFRQRHPYLAAKLDQQKRLG